MELTRRSFLKGLLALSASAAIPIELVKVAELAYADETPILSPPLYILINNELMPLIRMSVEQTMGEIYTRYAPPSLGKYSIISQTLNSPDLPSVVISTNQKYYPFLSKLGEFDFLITGESIPYEIRGKGFPNSISYGNLIPNYDEVNYLDFEFTAEIEKYE